MRTSSGNSNQARKILSYYRVNFQFSAPYQVLCDAPTIFQALKNDIYLKQSLPRLLGGPAYPVVTKCIVDELRSLGEDYSNASVFAKRASRLPCSHEDQLSATECIISRINTPFETKLILATNDMGVLKGVAKTPGVPLISISNRTKIVLKIPSKATKDHVRRLESFKSDVLPDPDRRFIEKVMATEKASNVNKKPVRKRKRAKEPNPLSVKKSKRVSTKDDREAKGAEGGRPPKKKRKLAPDTNENGVAKGLAKMAVAPSINNADQTDVVLNIASEAPKECVKLLDSSNSHVAPNPEALLVGKIPANEKASLLNNTSVVKKKCAEEPNDKKPIPDNIPVVKTKCADGPNLVSVENAKVTPIKTELGTEGATEEVQPTKKKRRKNRRRRPSKAASVLKM